MARRAPVPRVLTKLRKLCLQLPEAHEVIGWGEPTFRVNNKIFAMFASGGTHHSKVNAVWFKADLENQALMIAAKPTRYFRPPYVGVNGWVGAYLDAKTDWAELAEVLRDGYRAIAPKRLLRDV